MQPAASAEEFFISYNHRDSAWAEWIAWQLEANGYPTMIQDWDFRAGSNFVLDMESALKQARKLILVLSRNYLASNFTSPEWAAAFPGDSAGQEARAIVIRIEDVAVSGPLAQLVYVDLVGKDQDAAREALLSHVNTGRGKPPGAPSFSGSVPPPVFPGAQKKECAEAPLPVAERAQAAVTVEWPRGPLYPKSKTPIRITLPPGVGWVRIKFEYNEQLMWVSGPGKVPGSREFVCDLNGGDATRAVALEIGIHSVKEECVEPITAFFFSRDERQIAESCGDLELAPKPAPPTVVRSVIETLQWLMDADPGKPLLTRARHTAARLALLAAVGLGFLFYKSPDTLAHLKTALKLMPVRLVVAPRHDPTNPLQEFPETALANVRAEWKIPEAWSIEPGFMAGLTDFGASRSDGKLRLIGPGTGTFPVPPGSALYDFHMTFAVELPPQGEAGWIIRAQPDSAPKGPGSIHGYHFTLTNRGAVVYLSARAVGAPGRFFGRTNYDLQKERPLETKGNPCCSPEDRIRVQIDVTGTDLTHRFHLQKLAARIADWTEYEQDPVYIKDTRGAFSYGLFQVVGPSQGRGPAYEFIRLQEAK